MLIIIHLFLIIFVVSKKNLFSVHIITRHGDRNPTYKIPAFSSAKFDGSLTEKGFERMRNVGKFLRNRYLIPPHSEVYVDGWFTFYSTYMDRTKQSLAAITHELFPDGTGPLVDGECAIPFGDPPLCRQPVPIISDDYEREWMLLGEEICPKAFSWALSLIGMNNPLWRDAVNDPEAQTLMRRLFNEWGYTEDKYPTDYFLISSIDTLYALKEDRNPVVDSVSSEDYQAVMVLFDKLMMAHMPVKDPDFCGAVAGYFMKEFFTHFDSDLSHHHTSSPYPFYRHYSAHDYTLLSIGGCVGVTVEGNPRFGSVLVVEMYLDDETDEPFFKVLYDFDPSFEKINLVESKLNICGDEEYCDYYILKNAWENVINSFNLLNTTTSFSSSSSSIPSWYTSVCGLVSYDDLYGFEEENDEIENKEKYVILIIVFIVLLVISIAVLAIVTLYYIYKCLKGNKLKEFHKVRISREKDDPELLK